MDKDQLHQKIEQMSDRERAVIARTAEALETMKENGYPFLGNFMNIVEEASDQDGVFVCSMPVERHWWNPYRIVYGGVTATLADMAMAWMLELRVSQDDKFVTLDMNVNYHKPGTGKKLIARAVIQHQAGDVYQMGCEIRNDKDDLVVTATGSFLRLRRGRREE
ncbi:PaaI family thioesterase [Paenibacillus turpanensis]|uniref:PaaI family thioesterase n=1 Tax=Paenibacillus turpanensis TaxID=2689078 RepID=UPI00140AF575|nr:PaaI family thioesterase [Paenibacillus turpanensis]